MILPLGAGSSRKLFPVVTVALIAINCLVHLATLQRVHREDREDEAFWRKFEAGRIAPTDSDTWECWARAKHLIRDPEAAHIHWQWGFRKNDHAVRMHSMELHCIVGDEAARTHSPRDHGA